MQRENIEKIFIIIFITMSFGIYIFFITYPIGEGSVEVYQIEITYSGGRINENITCNDKIIEGCAFAVLFELHFERKYRINYGHIRGDSVYDTQIINIESNTHKKVFCFQFEGEAIIGLFVTNEFCLKNPISLINIVRQTEDCN